MSIRFLTIVFMLCSIHVAFSQGREKEHKAVVSILDQVNKTIKNAGVLCCELDISTYLNGKETGTSTGTFFMRERRFHYSLDQMKVWCDGKTMWTYNLQGQEVNISNVNHPNRQPVNPYYFLSLYKNGYNLSMTKERLRGRSCYSIHLAAKSTPASIKEAYLSIDESSKLPLCIRIRNDASNWIRMSIHSTKTHQKVSDSFFSFQKADYPSVEIVDLR